MQFRIFLRLNLERARAGEACLSRRQGHPENFLQEQSRTDHYLSRSSSNSPARTLVNQVRTPSGRRQPRSQLVRCPVSQAFRAPGRVFGHHARERNLLTLHTSNHFSGVSDVTPPRHLSESRQRASISWKPFGDSNFALQNCSGGSGTSYVSVQKTWVGSNSTSPECGSSTTTSWLSMTRWNDVIRFEQGELFLTCPSLPYSVPLLRGPTAHFDVQDSIVIKELSQFDADVLCEDVAMLACEPVEALRDFSSIRITCSHPRCSVHQTVPIPLLSLNLVGRKDFRGDLQSLPLHRRLLNQSDLHGAIVRSATITLVRRLPRTSPVLTRSSSRGCPRV